MMINKNSMLAAGVVLAAAVAVYSPDSNFILSPDFVRRTEIGYVRDEEYEYDEKCGKSIYRNREPNHIATLTDNFDRTIKVKVDLPSPNPVIIIRSVNGILGKDKSKRLHICQDLESNEAEVLLSYEYGHIVPAETYLVWVGDTKKDDIATKYKIVVEEQKDF